MQKSKVNLLFGETLKFTKFATPLMKKLTECFRVFKEAKFSKFCFAFKRIKLFSEKKEE